MIVVLLCLTGFIWCGKLSFLLGKREPGHPTLGKWHKVFWGLAVACGAIGLLGAALSDPNMTTGDVLLHGLAKFVAFVVLVLIVCAPLWITGRLMRKDHRRTA